MHPRERLEILPNNTTLAFHINRKVYGVRNGRVEAVIPTIGACGIEE